MRPGGWVRLVGMCLALAGCHRPYFMTQVDYNYYNRISGDFSTRERYDDIEMVVAHAPPNVTDFGELADWNLTLQDVKQLAMSSSKRIAVLGYQPGEAGTQIDGSLAAFDTQIGIGGSWSRNEQQVSSLVQNFGTSRDAFVQNAFGTPAGGFGNNVTAGGATDSAFPNPVSELFGVSKRNATGGFTNFGYSLDYQRNNPSGFSAVNPSWTSRINVGIQQPLFQGAGVEFNRAPLLIARAGFEQSITEFDTQVRTLLRDVERGYWDLYFSYQDVYSREVGLELGLVVWQSAVDKFDVGKGNKSDVAQAREQYESFRGALTDSQNQLLTAERELRRLLGLPPADGKRIIPKDKPTEAQYSPAWQVGVGEAMQLRPELAGQRLLVRRSEIELDRQKNGLLPDLTLSASYGLSGLDNQFDQSLNRLFSNKYSEWRLGVRYTRPLGERGAHAAVSNAQLVLSRQRARMTELEHEISHELEKAYREVFRSFVKIEIQRQRRRAAAEQLLSRKANYDLGKDTLDVLIRAQSVFADALRDESQAVVQYNQALVGWEFSKGTILMNDNVQLAEEVCCQVPEAVRMRVQREMARARPLAIHPGSIVHTDYIACPNSSLPLYPAPEGVMALPGPGNIVAPEPEKPTKSKPEANSSNKQEPETPKPLPPLNENSTPALDPPIKSTSTAIDPQSGLVPPSPAVLPPMSSTAHVAAKPAENAQAAKLSPPVMPPATADRTERANRPRLSGDLFPGGRNITGSARANPVGRTEVPLTDETSSAELLTPVPAVTGSTPEGLKTSLQSRGASEARKRERLGDDEWVPAPNPADEMDDEWKPMSRRNKSR